MPQPTTTRQDTYTWFENLTGLEEFEWLHQRQHSIQQAPNGDLQIRNLHTGDCYEAGHFSVFSLQELSQHTSPSVATLPPFEVHFRTDNHGKPHVDVAYLQARANDQTLFQVASNFNCAEVAHAQVAPDNGYFVSNLAIDSTQGPAASASGGVSAITRIHAPFYDPQTAPDTWGQTLSRQVELLGHPLVKPHFPVINGKLIFNGREPQTYNTSELLPHIRVGLHRRVRAYFGQRTPPYMEKITNPPIIDQVFVAALNHRAPRPHEHHLTSKTQFLLDAAYQGTYQAARRCQSPSMVLTLIGGGSFGNPPELIAQAIAKAHKQFSNCPSLKKVILPIYPAFGHVQGVNFLELITEAFTAEGIADRLQIKEV